MSAYLAGRAPLGQISNHAAAQGLIVVQEPLPWGVAWQSAALSASWALYTPPGHRWRAISRHITEGLGPIEWAIRTWDKPASNPTIIAARSSRLASDDSSQPAPPAVLLPHKLLTPYDTADRRRGRMVLMHLMALGAF